MIEVRQLRYQPAKAQRCLLNVDSLSLEAGGFHALIGPNGAGKSTLLRCLSGDLLHSKNAIQINGKSLAQFSIFELALFRAVLPQSIDVAFAVSVHDVVALGRNVYHGHDAARYDQTIISTAMQWLTVEHLAKVNYRRLSGGEQHRTHIARTLAQLIASPDECLQGKIWFLDEPTNHLDIQHQYALMNMLCRLKARGLTIVCVLHDLSLALNYADSVVLLADGVLAEHCPPEALVASKRLDEVYGLPMNAHWSKTYQRYVVMPQKVFVQSNGHK